MGAGCGEEDEGLRLPFEARYTSGRGAMAPVGTRAPMPSALDTLMPSLHDTEAKDPSVAGAKAAALAIAAGHGLPVLPGRVLTTAATERIAADGRIPDDVLSSLRTTFDELTERGTRPLVVRSSSTSEDGAMSSMAGMFTSVLDVGDWPAFHAAVLEVISSAGIVGQDGRRVAAPMAVLIQPHLQAVKGGVLFGVDPVTGRTDRYAIAATEGGPDALVSGRTDGTHLLIDHSGRAVTKDETARSLLRASERRALARLASTAAERFGGPQDIEWGIGDDGNLYLFQSRPVTSIAALADGPVMGPGPVAETFPDPLSALEEDLWIRPLRFAVAEAISIAGAASRRAITRSPVVTTVGGRVAADLDLFGIRTGKRNFLRRIDPRGPARKMFAAWRVGRLKAALGSITASLARRVDAELVAVPELSELSGDELLTVLVSAQGYLRSLHGYEILSGLLDVPDDDGVTGAELGLRALTMARREGITDRDAVTSHPEVLALTPPSIGPTAELPATSNLAAGEPRSLEQLGPREAMRMRIRWVQELTARAAWTLGSRLASQGLLEAAAQVRLLTVDELSEMVGRGVVPEGFEARTVPTGAPLPSAFRVALDGTPVPVGTSDPAGGARGAGGGRGIGRVRHGSDPEPGEVLVVSTLDPSLAAVLPRLGGLIAETGSVLSHLAILAREFGIPTVVGSVGALERYPEGSVVVVDGSTGEVSEVSEA